MVHRKDFLVQRSMYSSSTARMEADGIYISTNMETATEGICRSKQHSHSSDATEHTHREAYADFVCWHRTQSTQMWERVAATEHSESFPIATDALSALELHSATTGTA